MVKVFSTLTGLFLFFSLSVAKAEVSGFRGHGQEKLVIEHAPSLGKKVYLIKFSGVTSPWSDKAIKTEEKDGKYAFSYVEELSSGKKNRTYVIVSKRGFESVKGSQIPRMGLYIQGRSDDLLLLADKEFSQSLKDGDLLADYKKAPYIPEVE